MAPPTERVGAGCWWAAGGGDEGKGEAEVRLAYWLSE
jgi:hypothetical protein